MKSKQLNPQTQLAFFGTRFYMRANVCAPAYISQDIISALPSELLLMTREKLPMHLLIPGYSLQQLNKNSWTHNILKSKNQKEKKNNENLLKGFELTTMEWNW